MLELLRQKSEGVKWMKVKRKGERERVVLCCECMGQRKSKGTFLVPSFLLYHISTIFGLKKKEKEGEKVRKFRVGRHWSEERKGVCVYLSMYLSVYLSMCVHYVPKHWKLRLNFSQWLNFSWLLQGTPGGHLEEWGCPYITMPPHHITISEFNCHIYHYEHD